MNQLELFLSDTIAQATEENAIAEECAVFLCGSDNLPTFFKLESQVHQLIEAWDTLMIDKVEQWELRYLPQIQALNEKLKAISPRDRKARAPIKDAIARLERHSKLATLIANGAYEDAQAEFDDSLVEAWRKAGLSNDEDLEAAQTEFWLLVTEKGYHEMTWYWTLQECADIAFKAATLSDQDDEWRKSVREVRKRAKKRRDVALDQYLKSIAA